MNIFGVENAVYSVAFLAMVILKAYAFVSSLRWSPEAYAAAGKLTKQGWVILTGLGLVHALVLGGVVGLISLAFTVAALVYVVDVRPALMDVTSRR